MFAPVPAPPHPPLGSTRASSATYTLVCDVGTFTLTGQSVTFQPTYKLTCDVGTFTYTGQDADFVYTPSTPAVVSGIKPSGGFPAYEHTLRTPRQVSEDRKHFGLTDKVARAIEAVAASQAKRLEQDAQKQFEELNRELQSRSIDWDAKYLEALNLQRERLIDSEIKALLRQRLDDEEIVFMLAMIAAVA